MDTRKLIKFGDSSFVVCLPQAWISKNKLSKGDSVFVKELQDGLMIHANGIEIKENKVKSISTENKDAFTIQREIISAYINNYSQIEFIGKDIITKAEEISTFVRKLMSFEIMEQTSTKIVARDFLNIKDISVKDIVRRMDVMLRSMMSDAVLCTKENLCPSIDYRDKDVNRFYYLIRRVVNNGLTNPATITALRTKPDRLFEYYRLVSYLEDAADATKRIARALQKLKISKHKEKELEDFLNTIKEHYVKTMKAYYGQDKNLADKVSNIGKDNLKKFDSFLKNCNNPAALGAVESLKILERSVRNIARVILDRE